MLTRVTREVDWGLWMVAIANRCSAAVLWLEDVGTLELVSLEILALDDFHAFGVKADDSKQKKTSWY